MYFESLTIKADSSDLPLEWFKDVEIVQDYVDGFTALQTGIEVARMGHFTEDCPIHIEKDTLEIHGILTEEQIKAAGEEYGRWVLKPYFVWKM